MDPEVSQAWGSLRFCPEWSAVMDRICPKALLPARASGQSRVLFFLPKWHNRVNKAETLDLIASLSQRKDIQLLLKAHPRSGEADMDKAFWEQVKTRQSVVLLGNTPSRALVQDADIVIDVGSSIAIEAVLESKPLIYPKYLHENRLIFDEFGCCLPAGSKEDVSRLIDQIRSGADSSPRDARSVLLCHAVYCGREPFDVPAYYYAEILRHLN
jgi:hypothetical protein